MVSFGNTAVYAASRTLYALFSESTKPLLKETLGSASSGGTPLWATGVTLVPSLLAYIAAAQGDGPTVRL